MPKEDMLIMFQWFVKSLWILIPIGIALVGTYFLEKER